MSIMSKIMDDLIGNEKKNSALKLLKIGKLTDDEIADGLGITIEEVESLKLKELHIVCDKKCKV